MRTHRGVTLTDLMVLTVLTAVFAALLFPGCGGNGNGKDSALSALEEENNRLKCENNIREIGLALNQFAGENDGNYPHLVDADGYEVPGYDYEAGKVNTTDPARTAFAVLLNKGYLTTTRILICPSSGDSVPDDFPEDYRAADLNQLILGENNCSYGWDPTKSNSANATTAILADKPSADVSPRNEGSADNNSDNHRKAGQNVWYNDGHITWRDTSRPDAGDDPDIYLGAPGYEKSNTDAKIIR